MNPNLARSAAGILLAGLMAAFLPVLLPALDGRGHIAGDAHAHAALAVPLAARAALAGLCGAVAGPLLAISFWRFRAGTVGVWIAGLSLAPLLAMAAAVLHPSALPFAPLVVLSHAALGISLVWLLTAGALRRLDTALIRAASAAGAGPWTQARLVLLPALRRPMAAGFAMACGASCLLSAADLRFGAELPVVLAAMVLGGLALGVPAVLAAAAQR